MEKNVELGNLMEVYGAFLTQRQRTLMDMHVNEDLSLGEIAEIEQVSRQAVLDAIKRAEAALRQMEARLGLLKKRFETVAGLKAIAQKLDGQVIDPLSLKMDINALITALEE